MARQDQPRIDLSSWPFPRSFPLRASVDLATWPLPLERGRATHGFHGAGFWILYYADEEFLPFAAGKYAIPRRFDALINWEGLCCALRIEVLRGKPICVALSVLDITGRGVQTSDLRKITPAGLVSFAVTRAAGEIVDGAIVPGIMIAKDASEYDVFRRAIDTAAHTPRRGKRLPDEHFARVAEIYRSAQTLGEPPTHAVAEQMHTSRSNAGRWVMEARRRGFLGKATPGQAGEEGPPNGKRR
jgi:hypothetical protein